MLSAELKGIHMSPGALAAVADACGLGIIDLPTFNDDQWREALKKLALTLEPARNDARLHNARADQANGKVLDIETAIKVITEAVG